MKIFNIVRVDFDWSKMTSKETKQREGYLRCNLVLHYESVPCCMSVQAVDDFVYAISVLGLDKFEQPLGPFTLD